MFGWTFMTDDVDFSFSVRMAPVLRLVTLLIGSAEIIFFLLAAHLLLQSVDPLWDRVLLLALPLAALTIPGVLLAWLDRAPRAALAFVVLAVPVAGAIVV